MPSIAPAMPPGPPTRIAVQQGRAEEEERRGERAEQEVLQRRLLGEQAAAAGQAAHDVERQREHLERDEHGQQVVRTPGTAACRRSANSVSGKTSVVREAGRGRLRPPAASRASPTPSAVNASASWPSNFSAIVSTPSRPDHQDGALEEQRRAVDRPPRRPAVLTWLSRADQVDRPAPADQRPSSVNDDLDGVPGRGAARTPRPARRPCAAPNTTSIGSDRGVVDVGGRKAVGTARWSARRSLRAPGGGRRARDR